MFIQIEPNSEQPIYAQLTNQLIIAIANGNLKSGELLPSVRSLAADLSINMHTVNKAYHALEDKGIIQIIPKSGAVIKAFKIELNKEDAIRLKESFSPLVAEAIILGLGKDELHTLISSILSDYKGGR